jgi:Peptidase family M23
MKTLPVVCGFICLLLLVGLVGYGYSGPPVPLERSITDVQVSAQVKQGETLTVVWPLTKGPKPVNAMLLDRSAPFYEQADGRLLAYLPVSVMAKPGKTRITFTDANGQALPFQPETTIRPAYFPVQNIRAGKAIKGLEPLPGEMEAVQALKNRQTPIKHWQTPFLSPTIDCENSPFGVLRAHNGKLTGDYHKGVDLRSPQGRPVRATAAGRVVISRAFRLHGGTVGIDHGQGVNSIYIHLSKRLVNEGDPVEAGAIIGLVGATGFATGPHLHWGLFVNGLPVNPNQWLAPVPKCG